MKQILTPSLQIVADTRIRRTRELAVAGKLLFKRGDSVKAKDIVGQAQRAGELHIVRIAEQMGIEVFEVLAGLKVKINDKVHDGQIICEHAGLFGLFKSRAHAPISGTVEFINDKTGHIGLRGDSQNIELNAFIGGNIMALEENKSVTIESRCSFIQGIFGIGGERIGCLKSIKVAPNGSITSAIIPDNISGCILFGGSAIESEALKLAREKGAIGIIVGAIDDQVLKEYLGYDLGLALTGNENIPMTVILTEGFGNLSMSSRVHSILMQWEGKEASINGATQVRAGAVRPEIIITHQGLAGHCASEESRALVVGAQVRIIRVPYFGMRGVISDMPVAPEKIDTGAVVRVLRVKLEDARVVTVPRSNVEL